MKKTFLSFIKPANDNQEIIGQIVSRLEILETQGVSGRIKYLETTNQSLKKEINEMLKKYPVKLNNKEELISVIFLKPLKEQKYCSIICKNNETFENLKKAFYEKNPNYKDKENEFKLYGQIIDESQNSKTIEEIGINDQSLIELIEKE